MHPGLHSVLHGCSSLYNRLRASQRRCIPPLRPLWEELWFSRAAAAASARAQERSTPGRAVLSWAFGSHASYSGTVRGQN